MCFPSGRKLPSGETQTPWLSIFRTSPAPVGNRESFPESGTVDSAFWLVVYLATGTVFWALS